jgi:excisionase family DNA binding protein
VNGPEPPMSRQELLALPATLDVPTAARALGVSRTQAYELIRTGLWPTVRVGRLIKIPTEPILELLGIRPDGKPAVPTQRHPDQEGQ